MASKLFNLVRVATATVGTGTLTLGAAIADRLTFAEAGVVNGDQVSYAIVDLTTGDREIGRGTYTASGTTLSRDTVFNSTNAGSKISLSGNAEVVITPAAEDFSGRLIGIQTITTTGAGTYTPTAGTKSIVIEMVGGGGGGSGVLQAAASQVNLGGGGGGGGYLRKRLTANFSGASYVVGAKGTGGTAGNNSGTDGTATTFTDTSPTTYTAGGGGGGDPRTTFAPPISLTGSGFGGEGGTSTNGDLNITGGAAITAFATSTAIGWSSAGGSSMFGQGAVPVTNGAGASSAGANAVGKGTGGSGAYASSNAGGNKAGGDGADGVLIIYEYS